MSRVKIEKTELASEISRLIVTYCRAPIALFMENRYKLSGVDALKFAEEIHGQLSDGGGEDAIYETIMGGLDGNLGSELQEIIEVVDA